jgi:hypothetical protein
MTLIASMNSREQFIKIPAEVVERFERRALTRTVAVFIRRLRIIAAMQQDDPIPPPAPPPLYERPTLIHEADSTP